MSDDLNANDEEMFDAKCDEPINEKIQKDVLARPQARSDALPPGAILTPPASCPVCGTDPCNAVNHNFGVCPICHKTDGYLNVSNDHWFLCHTHKTKWVVGANLLSSAMEETQEQQRAEQERIGFASYAKVAPHYDTARADEESDGCHCFRCENSDVKAVMFGDPVIMRTFTPDDSDELEALMRSLPKDMSLKQLSEKLRVSKIRAVQIIYDFLVWNDDDARRVGLMSAEEIESNIGLWAREALRIEVEQDVTFRNPDITWLDSADPVDVNELRYMICREHPDWHLLNVMRVFNLTKPDAIRMIRTQVGHHYDELTRWHVEAMSEAAQRREGEDDE